MAAQKSVVWRGFDRVERAVGKPLEDAVASQTYADLMVRGMKVQQAVGGFAGRVLKGGLGKALRAVNIPTASDVQRLSRQIAVLTSEVRALNLAQGAAGPVGPPQRDEQVHPGEVEGPGRPVAAQRKREAARRGD